MELTDLRGRIDEIDTQLAQLFKQRMDIARQVAEQKAKTGKQVLDPSRERQVLSRVSDLVGEDYESYARLLWNTLFDVSRSSQRRALAQDTPIILLDEPTSFLDLPNRYELCTLLRRLAHDHRKCILFSTHELDIALSLCDSIALIDPPVLRYLPTPDMACSGYIERLFSNSFVTFDTESGTIKVRK